LIVLAGLSLAGCRGPAQDVRPDEASAANHREEAAKERALADQHAARYDPKATRPGPLPEAMATDSAGSSRQWSKARENPTEVELARADRLRAHAKAHEAAAAALERFESEACQGIPAVERSACPLLGPVASVENLPKGIRLRLAVPASRASVVARMRCHLAFARTRAFEQPITCPLYLKGLQIDPGPTPEAS
jgi:hypothetical protein